MNKENKMEDIRRKLSKDIDVSTMRSMREQGMTNKQIADALGVCPNTVYRYIGRMSQAVKYAEITNQPSPVQQNVVVLPVKDRWSDKVEQPHTNFVKKQEELSVPQEIDEPIQKEAPKAVENPKPVVAHRAEPVMPLNDNGSLLRVLSTRCTLQGSLCNYVVDSESGSIEMTDGLISGLLDRETVHRFIAELQEAAKMLV